MKQLSLAVILFCSQDIFASTEFLEPANVVLIMADDLGIRDTTPYGSTFYETPNIQRLADRGMRFTNAYAANPLCSPTRSSILTGLYPGRTGITTPACHLPNVNLEKAMPHTSSPRFASTTPRVVNRLDTAYYTLAEAFKDNGYATAHIGKWHLGPPPYSPVSHGFDVDIPRHWGPGPAAAYMGGHDKFRHYDLKPGRNIELEMAREAVRWMKAHKAGPFYLQYWAFSVHAPHRAERDVLPEKLAKYQSKVKKLDAKAPQRNPVAGAMVETLDDAVGQILDAVDELGIADNTVILFFSDNGGIDWVEKQFGHRVPYTRNTPYRGGKACIYEGGVREPFIVAWPGQIKPGSHSDQIVSSIDFYPTLMDLCGIKPKEKVAFDGISIAPALRGEKLSRNTYFCYFPHAVGITTQPNSWQPATTVRQGDWKLIRFFHAGEDGEHLHELYHLATDPGERNNLAEQHPQRVIELGKLIDQHLEETEALVPKRNPNYKPIPRPPIDAIGEK